MMEREGVHFQTFLVRTLIQHLHPKRSLLAVSKHFPQYFQQNAARNTFASYISWLLGYFKRRYVPIYLCKTAHFREGPNDAI